MSRMIQRYPAARGSFRTIRPVAQSGWNVSGGSGGGAGETAEAPALPRVPASVDPSRAFTAEAPSASTFPSELTRYARRKAEYPVVLQLALLASVGLHWSGLRLFPTMTMEVESYAPSELQAVEIAPPEVDIPPPPGQIVRPGAPVVSETWVSEAITIPATTFEDFAPVELPPPPPPPPIIEAKPEVWEEEPTFTPYTIAPVLKNPEEAAQEIMERYPRAMRAAGIGGTVTMWFHLDETGKVLRALVATSSGYESLDAAASGVAELLEFTPAYNRDAAVKVWVQLPIMFSVRR